MNSKMRKIKIMKWVEPNRGNLNEMVEVGTCVLIRNMVRAVPSQQLPAGLEAFTLMRGLHHSLKNAAGKEFLHLEDNVFEWLEKNCFNTIPAIWGLMDEVAEAIIEITNAKQYDPNEPDQQDEKGENKETTDLPKKP